MIWRSFGSAFFIKNGAVMAPQWGGKVIHEKQSFAGWDLQPGNQPILP